MELISLTCPKCGSALEVENGLDTFYCKYCGEKIQLSGMSGAAYKARLREKELAQEERILEKQHEIERLRIKQQNKESRRNLFKAIIGNEYFGFVLYPFILLGMGLLFAWIFR